MDIKALRAAVERGLLRFGLTEDMAAYLVRRSFSGQQDEWLRIADRIKTGDATSVYLVASHRDGGYISTFVYAPAAVNHIDEIARLMGTQHAWGYLDSPEGMRPAKEGAYPVAVYDVGPEVGVAVLVCASEDA